MKRQSHSIEAVFVFLLFAVFSILSMLLVFIGSDNYNSIIQAQEMNMDTRTAAAYISNKIHANDRAGAVEVTEMEGVDVLILKQERDGEIYRSLIYCYEDAIREALTYEALDFELSYGEKLLDADALDIRYVPEQKLISFDITDKNGNRIGMSVTLKSGQ